MGVSGTLFGEGRRVLGRLIRVLGTRAVIVVCLLVAASVGMSAWTNLWFAARSTAVNGVVVRQDERWIADWEGEGVPSAQGPQVAPAQRLFQAVVQFAVGDRTYEVRSKRREPTHLYPIGSTQTVVFPAGQPRRAVLRTELPDFWTQIGLLLMGTLLGAWTVRWWWSMARRRLRFRRRPGQSARPGAR